MVKELTEQEFIFLISQEEYTRFAYQTYESIKKDVSYKSGEPIIYFVGVSKFNEIFNIHYEATLKRNKQGTKRIDDFGFERIIITDEIDYSLDRINEVKEIGGDSFHFFK